MKGYRKIGLFVLVFAVAVTGVAKAQEQGEGVTDDDVNQVARELYCPICENTPLDVCETQACEDWRQLIREKQIRATKIGQWRVKPEDLEEFIKARTNK